MLYVCWGRVAPYPVGVLKREHTEAVINTPVDLKHTGLSL